ncbi:inorganic phosphate transporter [Flavobacterium sp. CBA20B-1]|uniref:inorganic phosphate transporter n=1 Tax=unclassified Flavobacterium TaxID=196869 RepID=UPI00222580B2|nr:MULTISPECIES: inorganic phosphate transporter [unclassified Flavobacterium]WCM42223.1 inorganic phosphate transporter [Flavobacterium sp. CBA20B-1]
MEQIYIIMLVALAVLAIIDIAVGVSNDAVNFLNSALGSKAVSFKTAMIVASIGILFGAIFSSGMMEIARSGIYNPSMFSFHEVMIIFLAVMVSDILLLDVFNSLGLPTSTTVSIVFELLGAAVCLGVIKILAIDDSLSTLGSYINTDKASEIVISILLSVLLSFLLGSIVQYFSRLIFTFQSADRIRKFGALFGGFAISFISFFILIKGLKGVSFIDKETLSFIKGNQLLILGICFVFWTIISQFLMTVFKVNILKVIILIGTFALALAFAGNDLVNFIGVPIAAIQSYEFFSASAGADPNSYMMSELANNKIVAPFYYLLFAGLVMVFTLWTSKKARKVIETEMSLSRQGEGQEKFAPNGIARVIVRGTVLFGNVVNYVLPKSFQLKLDQRFIKEEVKKSKKERMEEPAFDMIRASVNLMVASILIALGTSLKLPLSTTYVTFMVAMGTSFADRAWDRESAVYRVSGVFNVIGGWFATAIVAFITSVIIATLLYYGETFAFVGVLVVLGISLYRSHRAHKTKQKEKLEEDKLLSKEDIVTIQEVITESSHQISRVINHTNTIYSEVIEGLVHQDLVALKRNKKKVKKIEKEIEKLKDNVYYFIKHLDDTSVEASKFYVHTLGYLQDIIQSLGYISQSCMTHVDNNHKKLKFNQIKDIKFIEQELNKVLIEVHTLFQTKDFTKIEITLAHKNTLSVNIEESIQKQIERIRTTETSPKNSQLYFSFLLETNDLVSATMKLLELFQEFNRYDQITKN